jgi:hypothetical protein
MFLAPLSFDDTTEQGRYFLACARIRQCSPTALARRLFDTIITDQLILSILDDDSKPGRYKGEHRFPKHRLDSTK